MRIRLRDIPSEPGWIEKLIVSQMRPIDSRMLLDIWWQYLAHNETFHQRLDKIVAYVDYSELVINMQTIHWYLFWMVYISPWSNYDLLIFERCSKHLIDFTKDIITILQNIRLEVFATIGDQDGTNRASMRQLSNDRSVSRLDHILSRIGRTCAQYLIRLISSNLLK